MGQRPLLRRLLLLATAALILPGYFVVWRLLLGAGSPSTGLPVGQRSRTVDVQSRLRGEGQAKPSVPAGERIKGECGGGGGGGASSRRTQGLGAKSAGSSAGGGGKSCSYVDTPKGLHRICLGKTGIKKAVERRPAPGKTTGKTSNRTADKEKGEEEKGEGEKVEEEGEEQGEDEGEEEREWVWD